MRVIIDKVDHVMLGEPAPRDVHAVFTAHPDAMVPELVEDYEGEVADLYRANGWECVGGVYGAQDVSFGALVSMYASGRRQRADQMIVGPIITSDGKLSGLRGIGFYIQNR